MPLLSEQQSGKPMRLYLLFSRRYPLQGYPSYQAVFSHAHFAEGHLQALPVPRILQQVLPASVRGLQSALAFRPQALPFESQFSESAHYSAQFCSSLFGNHQE